MPFLGQRRIGCEARGTTLVGVLGTVVWMAFGCDQLAGAWPIQLSPKRVGSVGEIPAANDVAVSGGVAVLAQNRGGIDVLDVSLADSPRLLGRWRGSREVVGIDLAGSMAFVACGDEGFFTVDLTDPGNPRTVGSCGTIGRANDVVVIGEFAYVAAGSGGLQVLDVSNPASPQWRGRIDTSGAAAHLVMEGGLAFVATGGGLDIIDIANPDAPIVRGRMGGLRLLDVAVAGQCAFGAVHEVDMGFVIIDVSDLANPFVVSSLKPAESWRPQRVVVRDGCAHVTEYYGGLHTFDVSDPVNPKLIGSSGLGGAGAVATGLVISGGHMFLAADRGLSTWSLTVPQSPVWVGSYRSNEGIWARASAARLPLICIATYDRGLVMLDASDRLAPREIGSLALPAPPVGVAIDGELVVLACGEGGAAIVNVANPADPQLLAMFHTPGTSAAEAVAVSGELVFVGYSAADSGGGLQIIDISDPGNPSTLSSLPTGGQVRAVMLSGSLAFVGDSGTGLHVVDVADPAVPRRVGGYAGQPGFSPQVRSLETAGDLVFLGKDGDGFEIVDVGDPTHPVPLGGSATFGDCQAMTAVGDHLLVADYRDGVMVFDVSDPSAPQAIGRYPDLRGACGKIVSAGDLGFVPSSEEGVQVLDFSRIAPAQMVGWLGLDGSPNRVAFDGARGWVGEGDDLYALDLSVPCLPRLTAEFSFSAHVGSMQVSGHRIFLANGEEGLRVIDVADPGSPQTEALLPLPGWANGIWIDGIHAFVTAGSAGIAVVDITDPTAPRLVGQADTAGSAYQLAPISGQLIAVADMEGGLALVDVADKVSPQVVGTCSVGGRARDVAVSGRYVFVACDYEGLRVVDISNPHSPELVAGIPVANSPRSIVIRGSVAYLSDEIHGIAAVDISDPLRPVWIGGNGLLFAFNVSSDGSHLYLSGYYDGLAVLAPYDAWYRWRVDHLSAAPGGPFGPEAREGDDPDFDGLPNLMEFALFMDPLERDGAMVTGGEVVTGDSGETVLRFSVRRNGMNDGVDYLVEVSDDLMAWRFDPALLTTVRDDGAALVVDVAIRPGETAARFMRLRVLRR